MGCLQNWEDLEGMLKVIHKGLRFEVDCDNEKNYHRSLLYRRKALQWLTIMKITIITLITRLIKMIRGIGGRSRSDWPMTIMKITKITLITLLIKMIRGVGGRPHSDWLIITTLIMIIKRSRRAAPQWLTDVPVSAVLNQPPLPHLSTQLCLVFFLF